MRGVTSYTKATKLQSPQTSLEQAFICRTPMQYFCVLDTGLTTVNLSALTAGQRVKIFILMLMGDLTLVTVVVVIYESTASRNDSKSLWNTIMLGRWPMTSKRHDKTANRVGRTEGCA